MNQAGKSAALAGVLCLLGAAVMAAPAPAQSLRVTLQSKQRLVEQQLTQSPAVLRIRQSQQVQAKKMLAQAQANYARAQQQADAGRTPAAIELLDESLRQIVAASALVPDVTHQAALERSQNAQLREALGTFQALHKSLTNRMAGKTGQTANASVDIGHIDTLVAQADTLMANGQQRQANQVLSQAYRAVVSTLNKILAAETIVYDLKFDSPSEEFRHELARNRSYEELIPIALAQLNTSRATATLAQRHVLQSQQLRAAAQRQADAGAYPVAMKAIQDATEQLQRALRVAGVRVPQSTEITP